MSVIIYLLVYFVSWFYFL